MSEIAPFTVHCPDSVLADLRERLGRMRWPAQINDDDWSYGTDLDYLRSLCGYWATRYDWRAREAAINRFDHFQTEIDGQRLHFIHQRSPHDAATPLIITHGWAGQRGGVHGDHRALGESDRAWRPRRRRLPCRLSVPAWIRLLPTCQRARACMPTASPICKPD